MRLNVDAIVAAKKQVNEFESINRSQQAKSPGDLRQPARSQANAANDPALTGICGREATEMWDRFVGAPGRSETFSQVQDCATPYDVVYQQGSLRLLRFRNDTPIGLKEPVLVCFSLVNRCYIVDLKAERSVIRQLLRQGLDVYLIDWGTPTAADCTVHLHDYVCGRMKDVADFLCQYASAPQISLLGYCMGGTMAAMFTTLYQPQVRNLILLAAPIDFSGDESLLNLWTREKYFDVDGLIDAFGNCPGSFLQMCFQLTKPVQNYVQKYLNVRDRWGDDTFLENFLTLERWANDNIPVAGETFREFVKLLYQQNLLIKGQMSLDGRPTDLKSLTCPILILTADFDHLVPPRSALALRDYASSAELKEMSINAGHIGLAVSSKAHQQLWPKAATWIADHSSP